MNLAQPDGSREMSSSKLFSPLPIFVILFAGGLYLLCARGGLWGDEVLSLQWAKASKSPLDLLVLFRHDNNHPLNSAWMLLLGQGVPAVGYRALAVVSGIVSLLLLNLLAFRLTPAARLPLLILSAGSYAFALYFSEARGYGPAVACSLGALAILLQAEFRPNLLWTPLFWLVFALGLLSHPTIIYPIAGMGVWLLWRGIGSRDPVLSTLLAGLAWFIVPALLAATYYLFFLKQMMVAGGPKLPLLRVAAEFFAYGLGLPLQAGGIVLIAMVGGGFLAASFVLGRFRERHARTFFFFALVVFPVSGVLFSGMEYLYFRYFLTCLPFCLLLLGGLMERAIEESNWGRAAVWCGVLAALVIQFPRTGELIRYGRGNCEGILKRIADGTSESASVGSDHDMMVGMVVEYYRRQNPAFVHLRYIPNWSEQPEAARWVITSSQEIPIPDASPELVVRGLPYRLVATYPAAQVSGSHWFVYRQIPAP